MLTKKIAAGLTAFVITASAALLRFQKALMAYWGTPLYQLRLILQTAL